MEIKFFDQRFVVPASLILFSKGNIVQLFGLFYVYELGVDALVCIK